jgi:hypothetical protein
MAAEAKKKNPATAPLHVAQSRSGQSSGTIQSYQVQKGFKKKIAFCTMTILRCRISSNLHQIGVVGC